MRHAKGVQGVPADCSFYGMLKTYDTAQSPSQMGLKKFYVCAELVSVVRLLVEKQAEAGLEIHVAQVDFPRACNSILHVAIFPSM